MSLSNVTSSGSLHLTVTTPPDPLTHDTIGAASGCQYLSTSPRCSGRGDGTSYTECADTHLADTACPEHGNAAMNG